MAKITFMGAGSSVFAKNVLGDCILSPVLQDSTIALYDIDPVRLEDSRLMLTNINNNHGGKATIEAYLGVEQRKDALRGADFVINAIQVGLYEPCTVTDFEGAKKVRPAPDHWRYTGNRRYFPGPAYHPGDDGLRRGYDAGMPQRLVPQLYQPHGDADRRAAAGHPR